MEKKDSRNYGIDLLRVVSMSMIIILHTLGKGGMLNAALSNTLEYNYIWFLEILAYGAVDIFALISGYVTYREEEKKLNLSNFIKLWFEVVFYSVLLTLIFNLLYPNLVRREDLIIAITPLINNNYWYFTAYAGLFILIPFINRAIRNSSEISLKKLFLIIIIVFSIFGRLFNIFDLERGYSLIWIILLYMLGAIIKKCHIGDKLKWYHIIPSILILSVLTLLYKIYGFEGKIINISISKELLISYISPTILVSSILYLIWFSKMDFNNIMKKIIKFMAPATFSIYIINNQRQFWNIYMNNRFIDWIHLPIPKIYLNVLSFSLLFVIVCIFIDNIRITAFRVLKIDKLAELFAIGLDTITEFFAKKLGRKSK